jgi:prepilin-type processing-associated H-X9-DG protein
MHNYHDTCKVFPFGYMEEGRLHLRTCWFQEIWPFVEEQALYDRYMADTQLWVMDVIPEVRDAQLKSFMCPSDGSQPAKGGSGGLRSGADGFQGSYVVCTGPGVMRYGIVDLGGIFFRLSAIKFSDVVDGTSNTLLISEAIARGSRNTNSGWGCAGGYWGGAPHGGYGFTTLEPPNSPVPDRVYQCKATDWPEAPCVSTAGTDDHRNFARSYHPGGANFVLADASVRFIPDSVNLEVYQALSTRRGREVIGQY